LNKWPNESNRQFSNEEIQMASKCMKKGGKGVEGRGGWKGGEMTQTLYAHMNKRKKISSSICSSINTIKKKRNAQHSWP
jgi:hypothetical protein